MIDIERISEKIREEKDNLIAKAFTCQIAGLLLTNGIVPIMTECSKNELVSITDTDRYTLVSELGVIFDSLDTSEHDKKIYNQALEDMANKLKSKPYWDDEHNFQAIPIDYIDEVLEEITIK